MSSIWGNLRNFGYADFGNSVVTVFPSYSIYASMGTLRLGTGSRVYSTIIVNGGVLAASGFIVGDVYNNNGGLEKI